MTNEEIVKNKYALRWFEYLKEEIELSNHIPGHNYSSLLDMVIKALEYKELYRWRTIDTDGFPDENGKYMVHADHFYAPNDGYEYYGVNNFHDGEFRDLGNLLTPVAWKLIEPHEMENKHDNR